jgi:DNA ligase (NAD+)
MQSLDNTYSEAELREFHARLVRLLGREDLAYVVEPKIDGLAVSLTYEKGKPRARRHAGQRRRGGRRHGQRAHDPLAPRELKATAQGTPGPDLIEIRGEIYMTLAEFQRINAARDEEGEERYANPRNLAAGTIKLLDPREVAERRLEIVLYGIGACEPAKAGGETQSGYHARSGPGACRPSRNSGGPRASTRPGRPSGNWTAAPADSPTPPTARS